VPPGPNGIGAFGGKKLYVPARTLVSCDFVITVPVIKVHNMCGMTGCLKNYVGTAPRTVYAGPRAFSNLKLHTEYSVEGRIDPFIADLAKLPSAGLCVADNLLGLQRSEHGVGLPDQQVRNNTILAGEDPVAMDALAARLIGYQPGDIRLSAHGFPAPDGQLGPRGSGPGGGRSRSAYAAGGTSPRTGTHAATASGWRRRDAAADIRSWERFHGSFRHTPPGKAGGPPLPKERRTEPPPS